MLAEVDPKEMLIIDRRHQQLGFADTLPAMQRAIAGSEGDGEYSALALVGSEETVACGGRRYCTLLRRFHDLTCPETLDSLATVPSFSIGGRRGVLCLEALPWWCKMRAERKSVLIAFLIPTISNPRKFELRRKDAENKKVRLQRAGRGRRSRTI